jgi:chromate transport protein ChrA
MPMNKNLALLVAGLVFTLVAILHVWRLFAKFDLIIADYSVPLWVNGVGACVAILLAVWMFKARNS